ncbi:MAG: LamG-like jellyroll fold domain-containing protein [Terrimicrobiaceae bacterium]
MKPIRPPKILAACLALAVLQALPAPGAELVRLDLGTDTAVNSVSGGIGNGTVNVNTNGFFENVNTNGSPAGRAFNTGANGMGTLATNDPNVGTISWANSAFKSRWDNSAQFTLYLWLRPNTTPGSTARVLDIGRVIVTLNSASQVGVLAGGAVSKLFSGVQWSTNEWTMLAVTFNAGTITVACAPATADDLTVLPTLTQAETSIGTTSANLVLGNVASRTYPFDGAIGGFYLANDLNLNLQATFDALKPLYVSQETDPVDNQLDAAWPTGTTKGIFQPGETVRLAVKLKATAPSSVRYGVTIQDYQGQTVYTSTNLPVQVVDGKSTLLMPTPSKADYYAAKVRVWNDSTGEYVGYFHTGYSVLDPITDAERDPYFSVSGWRNSTLFRDGFKRLGVGANLFYTTWYTRARPSDPHNLAAIQAWITGNEQAGMQSMILENLGSDEAFSPPWTIPTAEMTRIKNLDANTTDRWEYDAQHFTNYGIDVRNMVTALSGRVSHWILYHELQPGSTELDQHIDYDTRKMETFANWARGVDPNAVIAGVGVSAADGLPYSTLPTDPSLAFTVARRFWPNLYSKLDIFTPHNYSVAREIKDGVTYRGPESFLPASLIRAADVLTSSPNAAEKTLGNDENGYLVKNALPLNHRLHRMMANVSARAAIIHRAEPRMEYYCYFCVEPCGFEDQGVSSFGLWEDTFNSITGKKILTDADPLWPRPVTMAYATVARYLNFVEQSTKISEGPNTWLYGFQTSRRSVFPVWIAQKGSSMISPTAPSLHATIRFTAPVSLNIYNVIGQLVFTVPAGPVTLSISESPLYLVATTGQFDSVLAALQSAQYSLK